MDLQNVIQNEMVENTEYFQISDNIIVKTSICTITTETRKTYRKRTLPSTNNESQNSKKKKPNPTGEVDQVVPVMETHMPAEYSQEHITGSVVIDIDRVKIITEEVYVRLDVGNNVSALPPGPL